MAESLSIVVKKYPHTDFLNEPNAAINGIPVKRISIEPIHRAFAPMVREVRYDVCELALVTFLEAREAGTPVVLLPLVLSGAFHHHSLTRYPGSQEISPADLSGMRVGVRAYSQTTGLWVRGILQEEFGVPASDVTWVTTEEPHVQEYVEPKNVERVEGKELDLLKRGEVVAAVLGPPALDDAEGPLVTIIPNWREAEEAWGKRHGTVPINHMLTISRDLVNRDPETAAKIYTAFAGEIQKRLENEDLSSPRTRALRVGITDELRAGLQIAIKYALEQGAIQKPVTVDELLEESRPILDLVDKFASQ